MLTWPALIAVAIAGGCGAVCRYLLDRLVLGWTSGAVFPWGTWVVNVSGSLALGLLVGAGSAAWLGATLSTAITAGFLGAYTTFSTWMYESLRLIQEGSRLAGALNLAVSLISGLIAAGAGLWVGTALVASVA